MTSEPVLVTGGAGFIGSHTCKELEAEGYLPVTVDNLSSGHADAVKWGPLEHLDVTHQRALTDILMSHGIRKVIHFAASAYVGESVVDPALYYRNNVGGMIALLDACHAARVDTVIFSSSCATYGEPDRLPITETTTQRPINPYGRTKLICEEMLSDHAAAYGLKFAALRYFNACGADPSGLLSERHDPETHLIPLALMATSAVAPPLKVFGTDYPTPDGTCIRDYIHVTDLARAHVLALRRLEAGGDSVKVNLGTGRGLSILEIGAAIERVTGRKMPWVPGNRRAGDPAELVADASLANTLLGFQPRLSDIDTIIRHAAPTFQVRARHELCA